MAIPDLTASKIKRQAAFWKIIWSWRQPLGDGSAKDIALQLKLHELLPEFSQRSFEYKLLLILSLPFYLSTRIDDVGLRAYVRNLNRVHRDSPRLLLTLGAFVEGEKEETLDLFRQQLMSAVTERPDILTILIDNPMLLVLLDADRVDMSLPVVGVRYSVEQFLGWACLCELLKDYASAAKGYARIAKMHPIGYYRLGQLLLGDQGANVGREFSANIESFFEIPRGAAGSEDFSRFRRQFGLVNPRWEPHEREIIATVDRFFRGEPCDERKLISALGWCIRAGRIGVALSCLMLAGRKLLGDDCFFVDQAVCQKPKLLLNFWNKLRKNSRQKVPGAKVRLYNFYDRYLFRILDLLQEHHDDSVCEHRDNLEIFVHHFKQGVVTAWPGVVRYKLLGGELSIDDAKLLKSVKRSCQPAERPLTEQHLNLPYDFVVGSEGLDRANAVYILTYVVNSYQLTMDHLPRSVFPAQILLSRYLMEDKEGVQALAELRGAITNLRRLRAAEFFDEGLVDVWVDVMLHCYSQFRKQIVADLLSRFRQIKVMGCWGDFMPIYRDFVTLINFKKLEDEQLIVLRDLFSEIGDYFASMDERGNGEWQALYCCALVAKRKDWFATLETSGKLVETVLRDSHLKPRLQVVMLRGLLNSDQRMRLIEALLPADLEEEQKHAESLTCKWLEMEDDRDWLNELMRDSKRLLALQRFYARLGKLQEWKGLLFQWKDIGVDLPTVVRSHSEEKMAFYSQYRRRQSSGSEMTVSSEEYPYSRDSSIVESSDGGGGGGGGAGADVPSRPPPVRLGCGAAAAACGVAASTDAEPEQLSPTYRGLDLA